MGWIAIEYLVSHLSAIAGPRSMRSAFARDFVADGL
jgi:hypothetical protein